MNKPGVDIKQLRRRVKQEKEAANIEANPHEKADIWSFLNRDIKFARKDVKDRIKENFYIELATLLDAGMDIRSILELVCEDQKNKAVKEVFAKLLKDVVQGASLSTALADSGKFSRYEYYSVLIGEESGKLIEVLKDLGSFFQTKIKQRRQIIGALTYPLVVLTVAMLAVFFMVGYVVPMFSDVFKRFGSDLPAVTKFVITVSGLFKASIKYVLITILSASFIIYFQRDKIWFKKIFSELILKMPIVGNLVHRIYLSRFANTMALLSSAKVSLVHAIDLTEKMISFYPLSKALTIVNKSVAEGKTFHASLNEHTVFPKKMIAFVKVGEQVNQLELFFKRISDQYSAEVEYQTGMLSKLLEPLIIVVLGAVVSIILIAMYLPMFKLGQPL